jgi:hypothetical protein
MKLERLDRPSPKHAVRGARKAAGRLVGAGGIRLSAKLKRPPRGLRRRQKRAFRWADRKRILAAPAAYPSAAGPPYKTNWPASAGPFARQIEAAADFKANHLLDHD